MGWSSVAKLPMNAEIDRLSAAVDKTTAKITRELQQGIKQGHAERLSDLQELQQAGADIQTELNKHSMALEAMQQRVEQIQHVLLEARMETNSTWIHTRRRKN